MGVRMHFRCVRVRRPGAFSFPVDVGIRRLVPLGQTPLPVLAVRLVTKTTRLAEAIEVPLQSLLLVNQGGHHRNKARRAKRRTTVGRPPIHDGFLFPLHSASDAFDP